MDFYVFFYWQLNNLLLNAYNNKNPFASILCCPVLLLWIQGNSYTYTKSSKTGRQKILAKGFFYCYQISRSKLFHCQLPPPGHSTCFSPPPLCPTTNSKQKRDYELISPYTDCLVLCKVPFAVICAQYENKDTFMQYLVFGMINRYLKYQNFLGHINFFIL